MKAFATTSSVAASQPPRAFWRTWTIEQCDESDSGRRRNCGPHPGAQPTQAGIAVRVYEAVPVLAPLGVGINLQPAAVRELTELGLGGELERTGVATQELSYFNKCSAPLELDNFMRLF